MPKSKYLYQHKKLFKDGVNQEHSDFNYYCSPKYAKIIGKKYGLKGEVIERAFNQYFEAMKYLGLTQLIDKDRLRRHIDNMGIRHEDGLDNKLVDAWVDFIEEDIFLRKSAKKGRYLDIFHEFNHLISIDNKLTDCKISDCLAMGGYRIDFHLKEEKFNSFNEGVTQFLSCLQLSYLKKHIVLSDCYFKETAYAHSLYLICGNALFEGYFNNDFQYIAKAVPNTTEEEIQDLADSIEEFKSYDPNSTKAIELDCLINTYLIEMFSDKVYVDVLENLDKFNSFFEIQKVLTKAYCNYVNSLFFGVDEENLLNLNRRPIFEKLTDDYFYILEKIADYINENPKMVKFNCNYEGVSEKSIEQFNRLFQAVNDRNYGFIDYTKKPINVIDYLNDSLVIIENMGKAEYLRKKAKIGQTSFMKNYELYEKELEILNNTQEENEIDYYDLDDLEILEYLYNVSEELFDFEDENAEEETEASIKDYKDEVNKRKGANPGRNM